MDQNSKVLLTLDNIDTIRKFINDRDNVTKSALEQTVDNRIDAVTQQINAAKETLENTYNVQIQSLTEQLNSVSSDNEAAKQEIMEQMAVLESNNADKQTALDKLDNDLKKIESEVSSITTDLNVNGLFTREQIKEIADTAFIESTTFTEDMVSAPNVVTQQLVALIGHFGQVKASNIVGSEIEGHTIKSSATITDGESQFNGQSAWTLYNDGSGHLAKGNINWDADGKVNLSDKVSLNWNQITGGQDAVDAVQATAEAATEAATEAQTTANAATTAAEEAQAAAESAAIAAAEAQATADAATEAIIDSTQINDAITTRLSQFEIASHKITGDLINGKTMQSSSNVTLSEGTPFVSYELNQDTGEYITNNLTGDGTSVQGPAWQIRNDGEGYLAQGNIQWNSEGKLICNMDSGSVGGKSLITEDMLDAIKVIIYDEYITQEIREVLTNYVKTKQFYYKSDLQYGNGSEIIQYKNPTDLELKSTSNKELSGSLNNSGSLNKEMYVIVPKNAQKIQGVSFYVQPKLANGFWNSFDTKSSNIFTVKDVFDNDIDITIKSSNVSVSAYDNITDDDCILSITSHAPSLEDILLNNVDPSIYTKLNIYSGIKGGVLVDTFMNYINAQYSDDGQTFNVNIDVIINVSFVNANTEKQVDKQIIISLPTYIDLRKEWTSFE